LCQFHYADRTKWKKVAGKAILEHAGENDCDLNRDWPNGELDYDLNADDFWDDLANHRGRLCSFTRCMVQTVATAVQENERTPRDKRNPKQRACLDLRDHMLRSMLQPSDESNDGSPISDDSDDEVEASATDTTSTSDPPGSDSDTPPLPKRKTTAKRAPTESPAPKRRRTSNAAELIRTADSMSVSISQCMAMMMQESQAARLSAEQRSREADERARADRLQAEERARASEERMAALIAAILARK
jgi:hypothetical protein